MKIMEANVMYTQTGSRLFFGKKQVEMIKRDWK